MRGQHQPQGPRRRTQQLQDGSQSRHIHQPLCDWQERGSRLPELCRKRKEERFSSVLSKQNLQKHPVAPSSTLGRAQTEATACRHAEPRTQKHVEAGKAQGHLRAPTSPPLNTLAPASWQWGLCLMGEGGKPSHGPTAVLAPHPLSSWNFRKPSSLGAHRVRRGTPSSQMLRTACHGHGGNPRCPMSLFHQHASAPAQAGAENPVHMSGKENKTTSKVQEFHY